MYFRFIHMKSITSKTNLTSSMQSLLKSQLAVFFFFLQKVNKLTLKFISKCRSPRIVKAILKKKNEVRRYTIPNFKTYCTVALALLDYSSNPDSTVLAEGQTYRSME